MSAIHKATQPWPLEDLRALWMTSCGRIPGLEEPRDICLLTGVLVEAWIVQAPRGGAGRGGCVCITNILNSWKALESWAAELLGSKHPLPQPVSRAAAAGPVWAGYPSVGPFTSWPGQSGCPKVLEVTVGWTEECGTWCHV